MQNSSAFRYLAIDTIHESTTNPRQTFEQGKLEELAESIRQHGLIQPSPFGPTRTASRSSRVPVASALRSLASLLPSGPHRAA